MNFDAQTFFVGLIDFFSIILPGALPTGLFMHEAGPVILGSRYRVLDGVEGWAAFVTAGYLISHLIFVLGSWLDGLCDWTRRCPLNVRIEYLMSARTQREEAISRHSKSKEKEPVL